MTHEKSTKIMSLNSFVGWIECLSISKLSIRFGNVKVFKTSLVWAHIDMERHDRSWKRLHLERMKIEDAFRDDATLRNYGIMRKAKSQSSRGEKNEKCIKDCIIAQNWCARISWWSDCFSSKWRFWGSLNSSVRWSDSMKICHRLIIKIQTTHVTRHHRFSSLLSVETFVNIVKSKWNLLC